MYCSKCSSPIPNGSKYCPSCGFAAPVGSEEPLSYQQSVDTSGMPVRKIGFGEAVRNFFTQYAVFSGRATRSEYWYVVLFEIIVSLAISVIGGLISDQMASVAGAIYSLATLIPTLALAWRRLHDIGRSGGWYFIGLIPLVGTIILLVFFCTDSRPDNRFGPRKV